MSKLGELVEKKLITNEFITILVILLICLILILVKGSIDESFKEVLLVILGFISRGALNHSKLKKENDENDQRKE